MLKSVLTDTKYISQNVVCVAKCVIDVYQKLAIIMFAVKCITLKYPLPEEQSSCWPGRGCNQCLSHIGSDCIG